LHKAARAQAQEFERRFRGADGLRSWAQASDRKGHIYEEEKAEIRTAARKQIRKEARDKARKAFMTDELNAARRSAGAMPQSEEEERFLNEEVRLAIVMPRLRKPTGGEQEPEPIVLDGRVFVHGVTYTVKRSQAIYLLDVMDRNRRAVNAVDGRGSVYYHSGLGTMIHQGGIAAGGGSMGMGFDALHKRAA
jgi:hypothetical protein